jgi:hypothetical protein
MVMLHKSLIYIGVPLVLGVSTYIILDTSPNKTDSFSKQERFDKIASDDNQKQELKIVYESSEDEKNQLEEDDADDDIEAIAYDRDHNFEITLINPDKIKKDLFESDFYLSGSIDTIPFRLRIPEHLVSSNNANITLRIRNLENNITQSIPAYFLGDLESGMRHKLSINSDDLENLVHTKISKKLP